MLPHQATKMLPSVALFPSVQPHHHMNNYHTPSTLDSSYNFDPSTFASSFSRNDFTKNSFESVPRNRLQHAQPIQRLDLRDATGARSSPSTVGEHALRRKTPNGTLAAGYDGTPGDRNIQPPATKHILVSSLESGQQLLSPQTGLSLENWQQPILDQSSRAKPSNFPPVYKNDSTRGGAIMGGLTQDVNGTGWVRSLNYDPKMDSVLNQTLPAHQQSQRLYLPNGAYVPTVHPATLQPCGGPTASAGNGPYGPYWPDGVYIPYRPAALRDSRFTSPSPFPKPLNQRSLPLYDQQLNGQGSIPQSNHPDPGYAWNQASMAMLNHDSPVKANFPPRHADQKPFETAVNPHMLPYHLRQQSAPYSSHQSSNDAFNPWTGHPSVQSFPNSGTGATSRTAKVEFKEKVLSWAHGVYVDLLASIHQARRNSVSAANGDSQSQRLLKPSIYPKPPRQPGLDFSQPSTYDLHAKNAAADIQASRPYFPQYGGHFAPPVARFPGLVNETPGAKALSALEMLSHLCMESAWEWIDGILLGGCLAYGLGDYHKAMRWYSRIIARDST